MPRCRQLGARADGEDDYQMSGRGVSDGIAQREKRRSREQGDRRHGSREASRLRCQEGFQMGGAEFVGLGFH